MYAANERPKRCKTKIVRGSATCPHSQRRSKMFERLENMDKRTIVRLAIAAIVGILLFSAIVGGIRQIGWNEGFTAGLLASGGDNAKTLTPYLANPGGYGPHGWGGYGWAGHGIGFIGGFFRFLFFGFLIVLALKFFAFRRWRHDGWHNGGQGGWHGGPWQQHHGQQPGQPQAEQGGSPAGAPAQPTENKPQNTSWINV
jgi:hypothetical protein